MGTQTKLRLLRTVHAGVFLLMVAAASFVAYAGVTGYRGRLLVIAMALVLGEGLVLISNGMACPLTELARRYGSTRGWAFDWALSERWSRAAMWVFGLVFVVGVVLLAARG